MTTGIGLSEIILILALMVIFVDSKQIPALIRKAFKIVKDCLKIKSHCKIDCRYPGDGVSCCFVFRYSA